jgi:DNA-binding response OmpR family regulator
MLRISAVLKRTSANKDIKEEVIALGSLEVNLTAHRVRVAGNELNLSPKEYELLVYMIRNKGISLTREKLISEVWGYDYFGDDRTLDTHIKLLRKKLGICAERITTLRGVGYRFEKD